VRKEREALLATGDCGAGEEKVCQKELPIDLLRGESRSPTKSDFPFSPSWRKDPLVPVQILHHDPADSERSGSE